MITVALINILTVTLAYLARKKYVENALKAAFMVIFLFLALRYEYGNDYLAYLDIFNDVNTDTSFSIFDESSRYELGWVVLCRLFDPLGFFAMIAALALINCVVYYRFVKKYVVPQYYWLAVFLYVFSPGFMLTHATAMRQSLALIMFIVSLDYLFKKDIIRYALCISLAALFHTSALILFPVYFLGLVNWKINNISIIGIFAFLLFLLFFGSRYISEVNQFISTYFDKYAIYQKGSEIGSGIGMMFSLCLLLLILYYDRYQMKETALLFKIAILGYFIIPFALMISALGRIGMYFQVVTIAVFPYVIGSIKNILVKNTVLALIIFITLYEFYVFFQSEIYSEAFGTYLTIFSAPQLY